ncbi:MAG: adenine methyltransferase YhdJ [Planctomycetota bacterium]
MAEPKRTRGFTRHGGYRVPSGAAKAMRRATRERPAGEIRLLGDAGSAHAPARMAAEPRFRLGDPDTRLFVGDCRDVLPNLAEQGEADLVFADPPFNWDVPYGSWNDGMTREAYERFTFDWLDACVETLSPRGSLWVNIPDDTAAEVVMHLKRRGLHMVNWCIWHFRFGQYRRGRFLTSKAHALYFVRDTVRRIWNPGPILEPSDRSVVYRDKRSKAKPGGRGMRIPMDVWYGPFLGRVHGKSLERRHAHQNQLPEAYLERVLLACTRPDSLVVDPFAGSGTCGTVARAYGRRSISIELSPEAGEHAWDRISRVGMTAKGRALGKSCPIRNSKLL